MAKKKTPRYKKLLGFVYIGISALLIYTLGVNAYRVIGQKQQLVQLEERKAELQKEKQELVAKNISMLLQKKKNFKGEKFKYDCPFLINNVCCVYEYRGVLCRTFGLMTSYQDGKIKAPFCSDVGLNYSNVLNLKKNTISVSKYKKLKVQEEPLGFNISYKYLTNEEFEQAFGFKFGEKRALIDWF